MVLTTSGSLPYGARCPGPANSYPVFEASEIEQSIATRFEAQAAKRPAAIAIKDAHRSITYGELNAHANRVGRALLAIAPDGGDAVALLFDDAASAIAAMLGVLKAGRCYVPLNPAHPPARLAAIFENSRAKVIVTDARNAQLALALSPQTKQIISIDHLGGELSADNIPSAASPDALAYIIYTSGSTGVPKGVVQNHRNVLHNVMKYTNAGHFEPGDRHVLLHTYDVGASVSSIYGALLNGGSLHPFHLRDRGLDAMAAWIGQEQITIYHSVPVVFRLLLSSLKDGETFPWVRFIKLGGEAVTRRDLELYRRHFPKTSILCVGLGATEMNIIRHFFADADTQIEGAIVPVGYEVADTEIVILDDDGRELSANAAGEIAIRSRYLFRGYWQQPELTASVMTHCPDGRRLYRTGDRGIILDDGCLLHLGRAASFTKIRGYKVEVAEVEAALFDLPSITDAAVLAHEDQPGESRLIAYVVQDRANARTPGELRDALAGKLPDFSIPSVFVERAAIPRTPNGKVDRRALPPPPAIQRDDAAALVAPRSAAEEAMVRVWTDVLGVAPIGVRDNFLALGGHSLLGARLLLRVREVFGTSLPLRALFENPTVEMLCRLLDERGSGSEPAPTIRRVSRQTPQPLSYAQEDIWRACATELGRLGYNSTTPFTIKGPLDVPALEAALKEIVRRHEVLRTTITTVGGEPMQVISGDRSIELVAVDANGDRAAAQRILSQELARPFDLEHDLPIRAILLSMREDEHLLLLTLHHLAFDGAGKKILLDEIGMLYNAALRREPAPLKELDFQYVDYAVWQRERMDRGGEAYRAGMEYWMSALIPFSAPVELPFCRPAPETPDFTGTLQLSEIDQVLYRRLRDLTQAEGVTLFMTLIAAFVATLHRATAIDDLTIGVYVSTRTRVALDPIVGFFINLVAYRADLSGDPAFAELLRRTRDRTLEAFSHREIPWTDVLGELHRRGEQPDLGVIFQYMEVERPSIKLADLEVERLEQAPASMPWGLEVSLHPQDQKLFVRTSVNTNRYNPAGAARLVEFYREILAAVAADPQRRLSELPAMSWI